jgi:hypothetical protein
MPLSVRETKAAEASLLADGGSIDRPHWPQCVDFHEICEWEECESRPACCCAQGDLEMTH